MAYSMVDIVRLRKKFFDTYKMCEFSETVKYGNEIIEMYEKNNDTSSLEYAGDVNNMAIVYDDVMSYEKAINLYKIAANIKLKILGEDSLDYADTISNMAVSLSRKGGHAEALPLHKKALSVRENQLDLNHKDCITSLFNLASAYDDLKKYDKSLQYFDFAMKRADVCEDVLDKDYADIIYGYARTLFKKGYYEKSISNYIKSVEMIKNEHGEKGFYYLSALIELATACEKAKLYEKSLFYYEMAIKSRQGIVEKIHLDYVANLNALSQVMAKKGDYSDAVRIHEKALDIIKEIVGEEHQFYADSINNIGMDYLKKGDYEKALSFFEQASNKKEAISGKDSISYTISVECMGHAYRRLKIFDEAFDKYNEAMLTRKKLVGESNLLYIESIMSLGRLFLEQEKLLVAEEYFEKAKELRTELPNSKDMAMVSNLHFLATAYDGLGKKEEALYALEQALAVRKSIYGRNHPRYARGLYYVAMMELKYEKFDEAVNNLDFALEIQIDTVGKENPDYIDANKEMIKARSKAFDFHMKTNKYKAALEHFDDWLELCNLKSLKERRDYILKGIEVYFRTGYISKAKVILAEIEKETLKADGEKSFAYAQVLKAKVCLMIAADDIKTAKSLLKKAEEIEKFLSNEDKQALLEITVNIGSEYMRKGKVKEALLQYEKCMGSIDVSVLTKAKAGIGICFIRDKRYKEGCELLEEVIDLMEKDSAFYSVVCKYASIGAKKQKSYKKASKMLEKSICIRRDMNLKDEENYSNDLLDVAALFIKIGDKERAVEALSEAGAVINEAYGDTKEFADVILKNAKINATLKKYDVAEILYTKAAEIYLELFGKNNDDLLGVLYEMTKLYSKKKEYEKAKECYLSFKEAVEKNLKSKYNDEKYFKHWADFE